MSLASTSPAIRCENVGIGFWHGAQLQVVLARLNLVVPSGQIVSLLGPSGCGKSTLLRVIAGLAPASSGNVEIVGHNISQTMPTECRSKISFVFQEPALLPWRTVWQNVRLPFEIGHNRRVKDSAERIELMLRTVGFERSDWRKYPSQLSGGMKMRASIARAMVTRPEILLLDEPFAALDDMLRSKLNDLLLAISNEQHCTMLFVTHNISEAIYLSHEIAIMSQGRIAEQIHVPIEFPRNAEVRRTSRFAEFYGVVSDALARSNSVP